MRGWLIRKGIAAMEAFPIPSGVLLLCVGLWMFRFALREGSRYAEFDGGPRVTAEVVALTNDAAREPQYAAEVTWNSEGRVPWEAVAHRALVEVYASQVPGGARSPARELPPRAKLEVVLSTRRPELGISASMLEDSPTLKLGTLRADGTAASFGALCIVCAVALLVPAFRRGVRR